MSIGTAHTSLANESEQTTFQNGITIEVQSPYSSEYNGELFLFNTPQDKKMFAEFKAQERLRSYNPIQTRVKVIRTVNLGRKWVNDNPLTPNWSKASSYSLTANRTVTASGSFSYQGASFGRVLLYQKAYQSIFLPIQNAFLV